MFRFGERATIAVQMSKLAAIDPADIGKAVDRLAVETNRVVVAAYDIEHFGIVFDDG